MTKRTLTLTSLLVLAACTPASAPTDAGPPDTGVPPGTYANVVTILNGSCAISSSCHSGAGLGQAHLNLQQSITAGTLVPDLMRPSCEYSAMPLLTPGDPMNSWLYVKCTGAHDAANNLMFAPSPTWVNSQPDAGVSTCPLTDMSGHLTFGVIMPNGTTGVTPTQAETLRQWIANGAPNM
jgi:hypothetical protein